MALVRAGGWCRKLLSASTRRRLPFKSWLAVSCAISRQESGAGQPGRRVRPIPQEAVPHFGESILSRRQILFPLPVEHYNIRMYEHCTVQSQFAEKAATGRGKGKRECPPNPLRLPWDWKSYGGPTPIRSGGRVPPRTVQPEQVITVLGEYILGRRRFSIDLAS
jgi:hypothetical protein